MRPRRRPGAWTRWPTSSWPGPSCGSRPAASTWSWPWRCWRRGSARPRREQPWGLGPRSQLAGRLDDAAHRLDALVAEQPEVVEVQFGHSQCQVRLEVAVGRLVRGPATVQPEIGPHVGARSRQGTKVLDAAASRGRVPAGRDGPVDTVAHRRLEGGERPGGPRVAGAVHRDPDARVDRPAARHQQLPEVPGDAGPDGGHLRRQLVAEAVLDRPRPGADARPYHRGQAVAVHLVPLGELGLLVPAGVVEAHGAAGLQDDAVQGSGPEHLLDQGPAVLLD